MVAVFDGRRPNFLVIHICPIFHFYACKIKSYIIACKYNTQSRFTSGASSKIISNPFYSVVGLGSISISYCLCVCLFSFLLFVCVCMYQSIYRPVYLTIHMSTVMSVCMQNLVSLPSPLWPATFQSILLISFYVIT